MGGACRYFHPNWFTRYYWGFMASVNLAGFMADQQYGVDRSKNPNIMWPWWHEIMRKKEKGEIPMEMPGYMLAKFRNECEEKWTTQRSDEFSDFLNVMEAELAEHACDGFGIRIAGFNEFSLIKSQKPQITLNFITVNLIKSHQSISSNVALAIDDWFP